MFSSRFGSGESHQPIGVSVRTDGNVRGTCAIPQTHIQSQKYWGDSHKHERQTLEYIHIQSGIIYNLTDREKVRAQTELQVIQLFSGGNAYYCAIKDFNFYVIDGGGSGNAADDCRLDVSPTVSHFDENRDNLISARKAHGFQERNIKCMCYDIVYRAVYMLDRAEPGRAVSVCVCITENDNIYK